MLFGIGLLLFVSAARLTRWNTPTTGGLILSGSLANTSFVGLPMIETFYGVSFLGVGILIDQLGTYMILSTLGLVVAAAFSATQAENFSFAKVMHKVIAFAPFQALMLALVLRPIDFPTGLEHLLDRLGSTLTPLALVSVGYQLRLADIRGRISALTLGAFPRAAARHDPADQDHRHRWSNGSSHNLRGGHGAADRRLHCCNGAQARPAPGHADGGNRYPALVSNPASVVVCVTSHLILDVRM
jgi:hypothetical protein